MRLLEYIEMLKELYQLPDCKIVQILENAKFKFKITDEDLRRLREKYPDLLLKIVLKSLLY